MIADWFWHFWSATLWPRPISVIDSSASLPASLCPASAILPLPACQKPSAEVENGSVRGLGFRLWTASQILQPTQPDPPADTASFPSYLNGFVARQRPGGQRWLDGYRRVLSTAAQGKLFSSDRRAGRRAARGLRGLSVSAGAAAMGVCLCTLTAGQRANMLTATYYCLLSGASGLV